MPEFTGRFQFRRIHSPKGDAALVGFACGEDDFGVDGLVRNQCVPGIKCERYPAIWILEDVTNSAPRTIGVAAWVLWASPVARPAEPLNEAYVHMIGVSAGYRKSWLPDPDGRSFGRVLLGESLRQIRDDWSPNPVPAVWASVAPPNKKSVEMFGAHGCTRYFPVPGWGEAVMWRPPKLGVV